MPMNPMVRRSLGGVSAAQMREGRRNGAAAAAVARNERREIFIGFLSGLGAGRNANGTTPETVAGWGVCISFDLRQCAGVAAEMQARF